MNEQKSHFVLFRQLIEVASEAATEIANIEESVPGFEMAIGREVTPQVLLNLKHHRLHVSVFGERLAENHRRAQRWTETLIEDGFDQGAVLGAKALLDWAAAAAIEQLAQAEALFERARTAFERKPE